MRFALGESGGAQQGLRTALGVAKKVNDLRAGSERGGDAKLAGAVQRRPGQRPRQQWQQAVAHRGLGERERGRSFAVEEAQVALLAKRLAESAPVAPAELERHPLQRRDAGGADRCRQCVRRSGVATGQ